MLPNRLTTSFCPVCYARIPAELWVRGESVFMDKACPDHGKFTAMVERDAGWWKFCESLGCTNIYDGYMIDVTDRCNLCCKVCYHPAGTSDRSVEEILDDAREHRGLGPIILTGGEPTLHPHLGIIVKHLQAEGVETWVLTNGTGGADRLPKIENVLLIGLSFHKESGGRDIEFLNACRASGLKVATAFWVIDDVDQMEEALAIYAAYSDVLLSLRIKAASNLWAEDGAANRIYTSDMLRWLYARGPTEIVRERNNKTSFANVMHRERLVMLISWYDATNIDLDDIDCGPWYRANDGTINNLVTTGLINEGLSHGKNLQS